MFWCIKSIKFHFWWVTKLRDQKQETENDCDVISELQVLRKTDFSIIFLLWANQFAKKWYNNALFLRKCQKSVFAKLEVLKWRQRKIALENVFLLYISVHWGDLIKQIIKICHIHFKLGWMDFHLVTFLLKCWDFQSNQYNLSRCSHISAMGQKEGLVQNVWPAR